LLPLSSTRPEVVADDGGGIWLVAAGVADWEGVPLALAGVETGVSELSLARLDVLASLSSAIAPLAG